MSGKEDGRHVRVLRCSGRLLEKGPKAKPARGENVRSEKGTSQKGGLGNTDVPVGFPPGVGR